MKAFDNEHVSCVVRPLADRMLAIEGNVKSPRAFVRMQMMAAHPIQQMTSYSGSGLPFACPNMALENTPNTLDIPANGQFATTFSYPNSYYTNDGQQRVPPSIFFMLIQAEGDPVIVHFKLEEELPLPLRTLTHRASRTGPSFYSAKDDVFSIIPSSSEKMMRAYKEYKGAYDHA